MGEPNLKPCPLCGKDAAEFSDCQVVEECANFEECDGPAMFVVVCDVLQGGCGCSTGYYKTRERAAEAWNRREERTCHDVDPKYWGEDMEFFRCSRCGCEMILRKDGWIALYGGDMNYCTNCGSKVER